MPDPGTRLLCVPVVATFVWLAMDAAERIFGGAAPKREA
jgi:hypothetical protein